MRQAGHGVLQAIIGYEYREDEFNMLRRVAETSGRPISFSLSQVLDYSDAWRRALTMMQAANDDGVQVKAQIFPRPSGMLLGLDLSFNPFSLHPSYQAIHHLPLEERIKKMRDPEVREKILTEEPNEPHYPFLRWLARFDYIFPLGDPPNYEPTPDHSIEARAKQRGVSAKEAAYDALLEDEGEQVLFLILSNYLGGSLDAVSEMFKDDNTLLALGDGGAHYGIICDASSPTTMLTYWARDRQGAKLSVPHVIRELTSKPANAVGLLDRGVIAPGYKADLNIIDFERMRLHRPTIVRDLPADGRRLMQKADGYVATLVNGEVTYQEGTPTGARPGRLVRGPQPAPVSN